MAFEDKLYPLLKHYHKMPAWLRNLVGKTYALLPMGWRYGKLYGYYSRMLKHSPYWSNEEVHDYNMKQLKATLVNAYINTSYYRALFDSVGFNPHNFSSESQLGQIPFSSKETLRQHKEQLLNRTIPKGRLIYVTTGGTSGIPVELYFTKGHERTREYVFMTNQWKRIGYKTTDRIARIRGTVVDLKGNNTFFKFEPIKNRLLLSSYDLYESNFPLYVERLHRFDPHFIHTYPSAILPLAKYIHTNKIRFKSLKGLFCSSEQFFPGQRETIEGAFGVRVYSWYGHSENTTLAGECEVSQHYHIFHEYGYTELIDEQGNLITRPGIRGEIVGTSFEMGAFPIIRYRTGDYAEYAPGKCSCGRNYKLITNVAGRWLQELIQTKKSSGISLTALNFHSNLFDHVVQYQYYQNEVGKVTIRIVKGSYYSALDEKTILEEHTLKLKDLVDFSIEYVDSIARTERGKHKYLIQEIP